MKGQSSMFRIAGGILLVMAALAVMSVPMWGQTFYGTVVGTVTDTTGGVIAGASVTLTNIGTNEKRTAETDASGNYRFVSLVPASYRLEVEMTGFKHTTREPITVSVDSTVRSDFSLEVGAVTEVVEVSSQAPLLQTETGTLSQVVEGKQVQETPLNGRNIMNLITLTPGVVAQAGSQGATARNGGTSTRADGWSNYQMGGAIPGMAAMYLDGGPINVLTSNAVALVPTQDAIQEFRVAINAVSAEFGRFGGGVVNMTTKSGANGFHGSAYEYVRNTLLNANDFYSNLNGKTRPQFNQNQYGANVSGPIVKDKVFFFFSWEGFKQRAGTPTSTSVPTADQLSGIFSGTLDTTKYTAMQAYVNNGCITQHTGYWQISPTCIDSTAKVMIKKYWGGSTPNSSVTGSNYFVAPVAGNDANQYTGRADYNISDKQRLFGRFTYWTSVDSPLVVTNENYAPAQQQFQSHQFVLGDTYTFNPTTILDVRASYIRQYFDSFPPVYGNTDLSTFGSGYAALQSQVTYAVNPAVTFASDTPIYTTAPSVFKYDLNTYDLAASLTKIKGRHTLKFGGEFRLADYNAANGLTNASGTFTFDTTFTGNSWASFLLGIPTSGSISTAARVGVYSYYQGYYLTDTWQATQKLTLNLGVRWELPGALAERNNRATVLLPNTVDPVTNVRGTLALVDSSLYDARTTQEPKYDLFEPRVGLAYRIANNTVIRAGYGLSHVPADMSQGVYPHSSIVNNATYSFTNSGTPTTFLSNPFPNGIYQPTGRTNSNFMTQYASYKNPQNILGAYPYEPVPYVQQWNLTVGHQFAGDLMLEIGYAGTKGTDLLPISMNGINLNELSSNYWSLGSALTTKTNGIMYGQTLRPYPYYNAVYSRAYFSFNSINHGMQVNLNKRFKSGGVLMANYTWSKAMGNTDSFRASMLESKGNYSSYQDFNNLAGEYSLLNGDVPHRLVISYVKELPFGKGQKFANYNGVAGVLVSGWSVNGITTFQSGFPLSLYANNNALANYFGLGTIRPNVVANCDSSISGNIEDRLSKYFNTACFTAPGSYAVGNESRVDGTLRSQGVNNWDFSILKATKIKENMNFQFRAEFFNLFNRVQFAPPATTVDGANFGAITAQQNKPRMIQFSLRFNF